MRLRPILILLSACCFVMTVARGVARANQEPKETGAEMSMAEKGMAILARAVELTGGLENYKKINSVSIKADLIMKSARAEYVMKLETVDVYPDKRRNVIYVNDEPICDVRDGDGGWKIYGNGEVEPMTDEDVAENDRDLMRSTLFVFRNSDNPPFRVVFEGQAMVNGVKLDYVALLDSTGTPLCSMGFDPDGYLVSKTYQGQTQMEAGTIDENYSEMTEVEGILIPMVIERLLNGTPIGTMRITEFKINPELPPGLFSKPTE